jgi:adenylate cyclase
MSWMAGLEVADQAMICVKRAQELDPDLLEGLVVVAMVQRLKGQPQELLASLDRIIAMAPTHPEALEWAAWSYMTLGNPERARQLLEPVVRQHPDRMVATMWLVAAYELLGRHEFYEREARRLHETLLDVLRRHPENLRARLLLASSLVRRGEIQAGIEQAELGIAMAPNDNRVRYNAACTYALAGLPDRALAELKEGVRNVPTYISDWPRRDPDLVSLHEHPEFIRMFGRAEP